MDQSSEETHVENAGGNCVIVTTLMSSATDSSNRHHIPNFFQPEVQKVFDPGNRWPPLLPLAPRLNPSAHLENNYAGAFTKTDPCSSSCRVISCESGLSEKKQSENHWRSSSASVSLDPQALVPMDANMTSSSWAMKRTAQLGPLVVVKRSKKTNAVEHITPLSEVEMMSLQREVDNLRIQLKRSNEKLEEARSEAGQQFLERTRELEESHREEERRHRQQFQEALSGLRAENEELASRVRCMQDNAGLAAVREREKLQTEWSNRLSENETQWRQRLAVAQQHWEECVDEQVQEKHEALRQVHELAGVVKELEMTLQQVTREKCWVEQELETLLSKQNQGKDRCVCAKGETIDVGTRGALEGEAMELRRMLKELEGREAALLVQLEICGKERVVQEEKLEKQLQQVRQELEIERRRGSDVVKLYSSQIESLHQQLSDALRRNKQLTKELARFQ
ncbi:hypothetical protein TcG_05910 [Trypanosoma cruzi]|uniref:Uncharacterized protein n=2 Tax=Trypanosoma cruzi TaxID=5693 RepID=V5DN15_TRYCR|nr:hypothetical protein TCDM_02344 [Trypanosoma cruzi Dm28c]PBJ81123.1 hypothetical protein BCY84_00575 [Trypanosoma cruzi cruzi]PWV01558.1 hypothetical protein C4B63_4g323 [Trypanosoma cruzi]RNF17070.1 hypothetical protein TcG_05910 [Trypanosoma cruzi]